MSYKKNRIKLHELNNLGHKRLKNTSILERKL